MAPLAARRLAEVVRLGERLVAIELVVAARAVDLRAAGPLGTGTETVYRLVRGRIPATREGEPVPSDLEPLVELVRSGAIGDPGAAGDGVGRIEEGKSDAQYQR